MLHLVLALTITPLIHSSVQIEADGQVIQVDPWSAGDLSRAKPADLILVTDDPIHHLDPTAIRQLRKPGGTVLVPAASHAKFAEGTAIANGETTTVNGITIEAIPAYDIIQGEPSHPEGKSNGYVVTVGGQRLYFAGVTECVPEVRALKNIDVAFIPMNIPLGRMLPAAAAECTKAIKPKAVYVYHYDQNYAAGRPSAPNIAATVAAFRDALKGSGITFREGNWYPARTPRSERLLYVGVPGVGNNTSHGGAGVLVFDIENRFRFVKRIPTWSDGVRGIAAHAGTSRLYVSTSRRLAAFDLATDGVVWEQRYEGKCCDRMAITPDGRTLYVPAAGAPKWYVVNAADGALVTTIDKEGSPHNTIVSNDGTRAYLEAQGKVTPYLTVVDTKTNAVVTQVGPFGDVVRPFTINSAQTLVFANVNNLLGFEVADLRTGKLLHRVGVPGLPIENSPVHGTPSHGIAMTADETEIWVSDNTNHQLHVFDATVMPPKIKTAVKLRDEPGWIAFSLDGKTAFASTGDMIDVATRKIVATLQDENGQDVESEKVLEIDFTNGKPVRASDQFGKGAKR